jgi:hypothetical protein
MAQHRARRITAKKADTPTPEQLRAAREWLEQVRHAGHFGQQESEEELRVKATALGAALGVVLEREFPRCTLAEQKAVLAALRHVESRLWVSAIERLWRAPSIPYHLRLTMAELLTASGVQLPADVIEPLKRAQALEAQIQERLSKVDEEAEGWHDLLQEWRELPAPVADALLHGVAGTAQALPLLQQLVAQDDVRLLPGVVETLSTIATPAAAAVLAHIAAKTEAKELQKAARRAIYRLKTMGVDTENLPPPEPRKSVLEVPKLPVVAALASHIDAEGNRALYIARRRPFSGLMFVGLAINDQRGVIDCNALPVTKKELTSLLADIQADERLTHVDLPPAYAQQLVAESYQRNLATGTPPPQDFQAVRDLIGRPDTPWEQPPIYHLINPEDVRRQLSLLSLSAQLFNLKEFQGWYLSPDTLQQYREEIRRTADSPIIVSQALQQERVEAIQKRTIGEIFTAEQCLRYRRRLEEMAYLLWQTKRPEEAKRALAAALALHGDGDDPAAHPFLRALFARSVELAETLEQQDPSRVMVATPRLWTP